MNVLRLLSHIGNETSKLNHVKPGLLFLLRLAWESRTRLPLLLMSGIMAMGVQIQMEIHVDLAAPYIPRIRVDDNEEFMLTDGDETDGENEEDELASSDWSTESPYDSEDNESDFYH